MRPHTFLALAAVISLVQVSPARAMPEDVSSLKQLVATQYGGNAQTYAEVEAKDFREMGCDGRTDLLHALVDEGLDLATLTPNVHYKALKCAIDKKQVEATLLLMTPDIISWWENGCAGNYGCWMPLRDAIQKDDYRTVRAMLESGAHYFWEHEDYLPLTREESLVLAAETARNDAKDEAQRAFVDAGMGHILAASQDKAKLQYIEQRWKTAKGGGGGVGAGGMMAGLLGGAVSIASGGAVAAGSALAGGYALLDSGSDGDERAPVKGLAPLDLATGRKSLGFAFVLTSGATRGLEVKKVMPDTLSARAGLASGDIVTHVGGVPTTSRAATYVATHAVLDEETFSVRYLREGTAREATFGLPAGLAPQLAAETATETEALATTATTATALASDQTLAQLERLADLRDRDLLSEEEFQTLKGRILGTD